MNKVIAKYISGLKVGDEILVGRFKNKRAKVKGFGLDEKKHPIVKTNKGDYKIFTFRIAQDDGFSSVALLMLLAIGFFVVVTYSRGSEQGVAAKKHAELVPGGSGPAMLSAIRERYLRKCTAPAGENNFFTTCIGVRPQDCPALVEDIIKNAQSLMGKPYLQDGREVIVTKFGDAIEVSALDRTLPDRRGLKRCQRNP